MWAAMVITSDAISPADTPVERPSSVVAVLTVLCWLLLAAGIGVLYVGHSPGPYGMCQSPSGHSVACSLIRR